MNSAPALPGQIESEDVLDELLTRPSPPLIEFIRTLRSPLVLLGAGGKMGPTLAVLARRAAELAGSRLKVICVSRFSDARARDWLETRDVLTVSCDLLNRDDVAKLPDSENVIYLVGQKFGTTENSPLTWAINTLAPAHATERYGRARIVALSTGNVYPFVPVTSGGSIESDALTPLGEYPNAAVARERIFQFHSNRNGTRVALLRLNYAVELRYGVLVDIASKVFRGDPIDVAMGSFNCIWQGDANEIVLRALGEAASPAAVFNLTGPDVQSVRQLALEFGRLLGRPVALIGTEAGTALLSNSARACARWGEPPTTIETVIGWIANWLQRGGRLLNKPTHFEVRDGKY